MKLKSLLFIFAASACFAALAVNYTWTGNADDGGHWSTQSNWRLDSGNVPATAPSSPDAAVIFNGDATVLLDTGPGTEIGYLKVASGTVTVDATSGSTLNCKKAVAVGGSGLVVSGGATLIMKAPMPLDMRFDKWEAGTLIVRDAAIAKSDSASWYDALGTNIFDGTTSISFPNADITFGNDNREGLHMPVFFRDSANVSAKRLSTAASTVGTPSVEIVQDGADTVVAVGSGGIDLLGRTTDIQRYILKSGMLSSPKISAKASPPNGKTYQQSPTNLWYVQEGGTSTFAQVTMTSGSAALRGGTMNFTGENANFALNGGTTFAISGGTLAWPRTFNPSGWPNFRYSGRFGVEVPSGSSFEWDWSRANVAPGTVFVHGGAGDLKFMRAVTTYGVGLEIAAGKMVTVDGNCTVSAPRNSIEPWKVTLNDGSILRLYNGTSRLALPLDLTVNGSGAVKFNGFRGAVVAHKLTVGGVEKAKGIYYESDNSFVDAAYTSYICVPYVWTGEGDGTSWSDGRNWDTGTVPPSGNTTAVDVSRATTVTLDDAVTVACLVAMPNGAERKTTITGNGSISIYSKATYYTGMIVTEDCELVLDVDLYKASNNATAVSGGGKLTLGRSCPGVDTGASPMLVLDGTLAFKGVKKLNHYTGSSFDRLTFRGHNRAADLLIEDGTALTSDWAVFTYADYSQVNSVRQTGGTTTFAKFNYETYSADSLEYTYYLDNGEMTVNNYIDLGKASLSAARKRYPGGSFEMSGGTLTCSGFRGNGNQNYVRLYGGDVYLKGDSSVSFDGSATIAVTNRNEYTYYLGGVTFHPSGNHRWFRSGNIYLTGKNGSCKFDLGGSYAMAVDTGITMAGPGGFELIGTGHTAALTCKANCTFTGSVVVKGASAVYFDGYSTLDGPSEFVVEDAESKISVSGTVRKSPDRITLAADRCLEVGGSKGAVLHVKHLTIAGVAQAPGPYYNGKVIVDAAPTSWLDGTVGNLSWEADGTTTTVADATTLSSLTYGSGGTAATNTLAGAGVITFSDGANIHVAKGDTLAIGNAVVLGGKVTKTGEGEVVFNGAVSGLAEPTAASDGTDPRWLTVKEGGATFDGAVKGVRLVTCGEGLTPVITLNEHCIVTDYAIVLTAYSYGKAVTNVTGETRQNGATVDYSAGVFESVRAATHVNMGGYSFSNPVGGSGRWVLNSGTFRSHPTYNLSFLADTAEIGSFEFVQNGGTNLVMSTLTFARGLDWRTRATYTLNGGRVEFAGIVEGTHRALNFMNFNGGTVAFAGANARNFAAREYFTLSVGGDVTLENAGNSIYFPNDWTGTGTLTFNGGNFFFGGDVGVSRLNIAGGSVTLGAAAAISASENVDLAIAKTATLNLNYDGIMSFKTLTVSGRGRGAGTYSATKGSTAVRSVLAGKGEILVLEGHEPGTIITIK